MTCVRARLLRNNPQERSESMEKPFIVSVDGVQVFSADYVFKQMQAQGQRIDRAKRIAVLSMAVSIAVALCGIAVLCFMR